MVPARQFLHSLAVNPCALLPKISHARFQTHGVSAAAIRKNRLDTSMAENIYKYHDLGNILDKLSDCELRWLVALSMAANIWFCFQHSLSNMIMPKNLIISSDYPFFTFEKLLKL
ncbi:MAG: hypothetical protein PHT59_03840 [Candidatus Omnitrophica bacterium]|nr:hypothetical protein [Candidatus Omnitrophota bacterium]